MENQRREQQPDKITVENLRVFYKDFEALKGITIGIKANRVTALIGPSGCGKSTFLRTLNRMNDLIEGVRVDGLHQAGRRRHLRTGRATWSTCARGWGWFSSAQSLSQVDL